MFRDKHSNIFGSEVVWIKHKFDSSSRLWHLAIEALIRMWQKYVGLNENLENGGFNQDVAKKCGSKWELGKMDRALIRMWQNSVGLNWNLAKWIGL